uniref:Insulin-like domain-containing protein n=1 Tax=Panagrellus redivivus TaxID=6233 RepID=A0A7E4UZA9_PANRE
MASMYTVAFVLLVALCYIGAANIQHHPTDLDENIEMVTESEKPVRLCGFRLAKAMYEACQGCSKAADTVEIMKRDIRKRNSIGQYCCREGCVKADLTQFCC